VFPLLFLVKSFATDPDEQEKWLQKLYRWLLLCEQWPYRTAWMKQVIDITLKSGDISDRETCMQLVQKNTSHSKAGPCPPGPKLRVGQTERGQEIEQHL
jgi:hypothetical protein